MTFDALLATRADLAEPYEHFLGLFWERRLVDAVLLELCRLRVAHLLGADDQMAMRTRVAVDAGLTEDDVRALPAWPTSSRFTPAQRAGLAYAEQFVIDPHGVDDAMRSTLREHLRSEEVVALTEALALFDGFTRARVVLGDARDISSGDITIVDPPAIGLAVEVPDDADPAITASPLGEQPETLAAFLRLYGTLWSHGTVPQPLKEVARIRNARITDCGY